MILFLKSCFNYLMYLIVGFIGFGLLFNYIQDMNNSLIGRTFGRVGLIITGFIGTVVHEMSHLIMCVIFKHEVIEVELFRPIQAQQDGILGYVRHSYDKNSLYQNIGNFFIGIAPLIGGTLAIILLFKLLLPQTFNAVVEAIDFNVYIDNMNSVNGFNNIELFIKDILFVFKSLIKSNEIGVGYFLFIFSTYSIANNMSLSRADLENSISGLIFIIVFLVFFSLVTIVIGIDTSPSIEFLKKYYIFLILIMMIGLCFSLLTLIISHTVALFFKN